ncbi:MAG: GLUG motif-containing protein, partial [Coprobacillaceae bacterium]
MKNILKMVTTSLITLSMLLAFITVTAENKKVFAQGTDNDGFTLIETAAELDILMRSNLSGNYRLKNDIDLTGYISKTNTSTVGWKPVGTFKGTFDGNGYTIKGLWSKYGAYNGLFSITENATIKNVTIELDSQGISGAYEVGGIVGYANKATLIDNCHVKGGQILVTGGGFAGGIVGASRGPNGKVSNCTVTDTYTQTSGNYSGGIIGVAYRTAVEGCDAINTSSTGFSYVGGIAGAIHGQASITNCNASSEISSKGPYAGGLLGVTYEQSTISDSNATGNVVSTYAGDAYVGGFAGAIYGASKVTNSCATGNATATKGQIAGGFAAISYGSSSITKAIAMGDATSNGNYAGGFLAKLHAGAISLASTVDQVAAYGNATAKGYVVGGLIGESLYSKVSNSYAQGDVSGTTGVGGLVGYFSGSALSGQTVYNSYSSGKVTGKTSSSEYGAFTGRSGVTFTGTNYYDRNTAGVSNAYGTAGAPKGTYPVGYSTTEMMQQANFIGWDFDTIWKIDEGKSYPYFDFCCKSSNNKIEVTFDKNADEATGTMDNQVITKDTATALNTNAFERDEHLFLGWSTTPTGDFEYVDGAEVTLSDATTLYAIWGTPDLYFDTYFDQAEPTVGDILTVTHVAGNDNTKNSLTLYNTIMYIEVPEGVDYVYDSVTATINGGSIYLRNTYNPTTRIITVTIGPMNPGEEFAVSYGVVPRVEANYEFNFTTTGTLTLMRSFADTSNHEIVRTSGATINIGPSSTEKTDDAIQSTQDN